jgi:hypothetical protein
MTCEEIEMVFMLNEAKIETLGYRKDKSKLNSFL